MIKEKSLPKGIFLSGFQGVGKSTFGYSLFKILENRGFIFIYENFQKGGVIPKVFSFFTKKKQDTEIKNRVLEAIFNSKNFISDTVPFHNSYIHNIFEKLNSKEIQKAKNIYTDMIKVFEKEILNIKVDTTEYLFILLTNSNSYDNYSKRIGVNSSESKYTLFKQIYEENIRKFGEYLKKNRINYIEINVTNYDLKSHEVVKKILEEKLLLKND